MKTFKKLALVSAIAAAPFAAQAMEALDDSVLGNTTGQAGVTIDMSIGDAGITIGSVTYTDTKGSADNDGGSVVLENIAIKNITNLSQTIDVSGTGNLVMGMTGSQALVQKEIVAGVVQDKTISAVAEATDYTGATLLTTVADVTSLTAAEVTAENEARTAAISAGTGVAGITIALGGTAATSAVLLRGNASNTGEAELVNNLSMNVDLGNSTTTIHNLANTTNGTLGDAGVLNAAGAASTDKGAIVIDMAASFRLNDLDVGVFGYTEDQAKVGALANAGVISAKGTLDTLAPAGLAYDAEGKATTTSVVAADVTAVATYNGTVDATVAGIANGAAIKINNMSFMGLDGGMVTASQKIWATSKGVNIQMGAIAGNLNIGSIEIGGASIGSVAIANLNLAGMTQTIYGH